jgi:hypothetical protein
MACDRAAAIPGLLQQAVSSILERNPLGEISVDRMVDLGPHFCRLSPSLQRTAQEDWLDADFLREWRHRISEIRIVDLDSEMGQDLLELSATV